MSEWEKLKAVSGGIWLWSPARGSRQAGGGGFKRSAHSAGRSCKCRCAWDEARWTVWYVLVSSDLEKYPMSSEQTSRRGPLWIIFYPSEGSKVIQKGIQKWSQKGLLKSNPSWMTPGSQKVSFCAPRPVSKRVEFWITLVYRWCLNYIVDVKGFCNAS